MPGSLLAFGVPTWPTVGRSWDPWSLALPLLGIVMARTLFGVPLTARSTAVLALGGTAAAWLVPPLGLLPAIGLGLLALTAWTLVRRSRPRER